MAEFVERAISRWVMDARGLDSPMVFIAGPRQVGKTALARTWCDSEWNFDTVETKKALLRDPYFFQDDSGQWVLLDEIHKRRDWKKLLKGYYDSPTRSHNFIVTGSGRFDTFQRGGDSLQGRYDLFHLWPLIVDEIRGGKRACKPRNFKTWVPDSVKVSTELLQLGGFPAPFVRHSVSGLRRWNDQYVTRLVNEDVRDFSAVQRLDALEMLARLLPERVTSPISIQSLAQDIDVSPVAIKSWLRLFETLFLGFQLKPFHRLIHRAVKREKKWYFYQWTFVEDPAGRFENYVAVQLASMVSYWREQGHGRFELYYLRDQDRREVDFLITLNGRPHALVEAKLSPQPWTTALSYYARKLDIPAYLVYPEGPVRKTEQLGFSLPADTFFAGTVLR